MKVNKEITGIIITASVLVTVTGSHYLSEKEQQIVNHEITPEIVDLEIEEDSEKPVRELKIKPKASADLVSCMSEESYTLNDVISQIEIEDRRGNGMCVGILKNIQAKLQIELDEIEAARPITPTPKGRGGNILTPEPTVSEEAIIE